MPSRTAGARLGDTGARFVLSYPNEKLAVFAASLIGFFLLGFLIRYVVQHVLGVKAPPNILSNTVSTLHALIVVSTAAYTFINGDGDIGSGAEASWIGSVGLVISAAYFIWDIHNMIVTGFEPLVPLLLHHVISGISMAVIAGWVPRAVWYTCILQMTEGTVPISNVVTLLEWRQKQHSTAYVLGRWALLIVWLVLRIAIVLYFLFPVWRDWAGMTDIMHFLALNGPALLVFNIGALFSMVLKGFPWLGGDSKAKQS